MQSELTPTGMTLKLDAIDHQILDLLAENARVSNRSIAKVVGRSDRTVARRIQKMETLGIIQQYTLRIDPTFLGVPSVVHQPQLMTSISEWENIRSSLMRYFSSSAGFILFHIGYSISQNLSLKIQETGLMPRSQLLLFTQLLEERGWGHIDIRHLDVENRSGAVILVNSPFIKQQRPYRCDEIKGLITGFLETLFVTTILVTEEKCVNQGYTHCEFTFAHTPLEQFISPFLSSSQHGHLNLVER